MKNIKLSEGFLNKFKKRFGPQKKWYRFEPLEQPECKRCGAIPVEKDSSGRETGLCSQCNWEDEYGIETDIKEITEIEEKEIDDMIECPDCLGTGIGEYSTRSGDYEEKECENCKGTGHVSSYELDEYKADKNCKLCGKTNEYDDANLKCTGCGAPLKVQKPEFIPQKKKIDPDELDRKFNLSNEGILSMSSIKKELNEDVGVTSSDAGVYQKLQGRVYPNWHYQETPRGWSNTTPEGTSNLGSKKVKKNKYFPRMGECLRLEYKERRAAKVLENVDIESLFNEDITNGYVPTTLEDKDPQHPMEPKRIVYDKNKPCPPIKSKDLLGKDCQYFRDKDKMGEPTTTCVRCCRGEDCSFHKSKGN